MRIAMVGTGYVGLTTGALFADRGNSVVCVDNKSEVVEMLRRGEVHIYEPGLREVVKRNVDRETLTFSNSLEEAVKWAEGSFITVGTPSRQDGSFNLDQVLGVAKEIGFALRNTDGFRLVVMKSTVPPGSWERVTEAVEDGLGEYGGKVDWAYVANPETLAEGKAIEDFTKPDRVMIGTDSDRAFELMDELYHPFVRKKGLTIRGTPGEVELSKLLANAILPCRVAVINEGARIADRLKNVDMEVVRRMVGTDSRIGEHFLYPGPGYGGSCFPKDIRGLVAASHSLGYSPILLSRIDESNDNHKRYEAERVMGLIGRNRPKIGVWGLTFKPGTDDVREAASLTIVNYFVERGAEVTAYDPQDRKARLEFGDKINFASDQYLATQGADALVLLTEWEQFDSPDFVILKSKMRGRKLFDLRNRWKRGIAERNGFDYFGVGRNFPLEK